MRRGVPSSVHRVILVTGDVVTVTTLADGQQIAAVAGRWTRSAEYGCRSAAADLYVVPDEAVACSARTGSTPGSSTSPP